MTQYFLLSVVIVYHVFIHKGLPVTLLISIYVSLFSLYLYPLSLSVCLSVSLFLSLPPSNQSFLPYFAFLLGLSFYFNFIILSSFSKTSKEAHHYLQTPSFSICKNLLTIVLSFTFQSFRGPLDKK